ncbi:MAG: hypothetical protein R3C59_03065 [Planctomycetaceae bacterium]
MTHDAQTSSRRERGGRNLPPSSEPDGVGIGKADEIPVPDQALAAANLPEIVVTAETTHRTWSELLLGAAATSYYLSFLLHLVAYSTAAAVFVWLGHHLLEQEKDVPPLRASLDDVDHEGEQPKFEAVADLDLTQADSQTREERLSSNLRIVKDGLDAAMPNDFLPSMMGSDENGDSTAGSEEFLFKLPESGLAVTKGSFTVWADPEVPRVNEDYKLIVEIRLPDSVRAYRINDLSGRVIGSDGYHQKIPYDSNSRGAVSYTDENLKVVPISSSSESIKVRDNKVQLVINVLGAARLVKDVIQVRSRRLKENQELELIFGGRPPDSSE